MPRIRLLPLLLLAVAITVPAQASPKANPKGTTAIAKVGLEDPFTKGDPKAMAKLGVVGYGPLDWADNLRTTNIETVLGEGRFLWMETANFRIGSSLGFVGGPKDPVARKLLKGELARLDDKCSKIPSGSSKLDPWLRVHLFAQRAEELYAEFAALSGLDEEGKHLGREQKFLVLLFQQKSDLVRYMDRFCNRKVENTLTHCHGSGHHIVVLTAEGDDGPRDCESVHAQFRYHLMRALLAAAGNGPWWLAHGLAHRYEREVPCDLMNCGIGENESVDPATRNDWERKLGKRVKHEELCIPFGEMAASVDGGYYWHIQAWSRVDYLMQDRERFAPFLRKILQNSGSSSQFQALDEHYGLTPEEFDAEWRAWAAKTYK